MTLNDAEKFELARKVRSRRDIPYHYRLLFGAMLDEYRTKTGRCFPSYETLAAAIGANRRNVITWVDDLACNKLVLINDGSDNKGGKGKSNSYSFPHPDEVENGDCIESPFKKRQRDSKKEDGSKQRVTVETQTVTGKALNSDSMESPEPMNHESLGSSVQTQKCSCTSEHDTDSESQVDGQSTRALEGARSSSPPATVKQPAAEKGPATARVRRRELSPDDVYEW